MVGLKSEILVKSLKLDVVLGDLPNNFISQPGVRVSKRKSLNPHPGILKGLLRVHYDGADPRCETLIDEIHSLSIRSNPVLKILEL